MMEEPKAVPSQSGKEVVEPGAAGAEKLSPKEILERILMLRLNKINGASLSKYLPIQGQLAEREKQKYRLRRRFQKHHDLLDMPVRLKDAE